MTTRGIKVRDIVEVAREGWAFVGMVTGIVVKAGGGREFHVAPMDTAERCTHRIFRARHIKGHWQRRHSVS